MKAKIFVTTLSLLILFINEGMVSPFGLNWVSGKIAAVASVSDTGKACINFSVTNIKNYKGAIYVAFYKDPSTFLKKGKETFSRAATPTGKGTQIIKICDVEPGLYAVAVMQDVHNTGNMKMDILGLPEDPYGFSNITHGVVLPPAFKKCSFYVQEGKEATIKVRLMNP